MVYEGFEVCSVGVSLMQQPPTQFHLRGAIVPGAGCIFGHVDDYKHLKVYYFRENLNQSYLLPV